MEVNVSAKSLKGYLMKTSLRPCFLLIAGWIAVYTMGCAEDVEPEIDPVVFASAAPAIDSDIAANDPITLTFDSTPTDISVSAGPDTKVGKTVITGRTVTIHGPFALGALNLTVTWLDGQTTLTYTVTSADPEDANVADGTSAGQPVEVTDETFTAIVLDAKLPVVLELRAAWSGSCRLMDPTVKEVMSEASGPRGRFIVARLDIDKNPETTQKYGGQGIPAYIVFRNGKVIGRMLGVMPKGVFLSRIRAILLKQ